MSRQKAGPRLAVTISFMPIPSPTFYYSYFHQKKTFQADMVEQGMQWVDPYSNKAEGKKFHLSRVHATNWTG